MNPQENNQNPAEQKKEQPTPIAPIQSPTQQPRTAHPSRGPRPFNSMRRGAPKMMRRPARPPHQLHNRAPHPMMPQDANNPYHQNIPAAPLIPSPGENIRIIPLGGVEEVGRNMTAIEYKDDIIVLDAGFQFKDENTPGIDYIIPNIKYLEERKHKIRGLVISHAHLDHIGGLPYIIDRIGNPPIYTRNLTAIMIQKRQTEFPHLAPLNIKIVENADRLKLGNIPVRFFAVTHTVPDSMGLVVETPFGWIVVPSDYKLDHVDGIPTEAEEKSYSIFDNQKVLLMMSDSTNIENPGFSTPEKLVHKNLDEIIHAIKGRLIISMFASQIERICAIVMSAEKYGKKIVVEGRSMKSTIEIATLAGILKIKKDTVIPSTEIDRYSPDKIVVLATGAQGDDFTALVRMATKEHKTIHLTPRDTVLLSASIIPGNEKSVQKLKDNITRRGARIIHYRTSDVYIHSTGHGNRGELEWLHKKVKPQFFIPIHGNHYMLKLHADLAESLGMPKANIIVPDDCDIIEIQENGTKLVKLKEKAGEGFMIVDGFSVGNIQEVVIRDRQMLSEDGMFIIVAMVDSRTGRLNKSPDIISRGFVYLRESQELLREARHIIKKTIEDSTVGMNPINLEFVKGNLTESISRFLFQQTAKRPVVIPVLLGM